MGTLETERNRLENDNILLQDQVANVNKGKMVIREVSVLNQPRD